MRKLNAKLNNNVLKVNTNGSITLAQWFGHSPGWNSTLSGTLFKQLFIHFTFSGLWINALTLQNNSEVAAVSASESGRSRVGVCFCQDHSTFI